MPAQTARRSRDQVRAAVLARALELAEDRQFADLTVEEIARAAGISRSAFYVHFRDKQDLLLAAVEEVAGELSGMADRWWHGEGEPPAALVRKSTTGVVEVWAEHASLLRAVIEAAGYDENLRERWFATVGRFIDATAEHLRSERQKGLLAERLDPQATAEALVWGIERYCYVYISRERRPAAEVADQLTNIWVSALYPGVVTAQELRPPS